jgi:hypothetical protein
MVVCVFLCRAVFSREMLFDGPVPRPGSPTKYLEEFIVSEVNSDLEQSRGRDPLTLKKFFIFNNFRIFQCGTNIHKISRICGTSNEAHRSVRLV